MIKTLYPVFQKWSEKGQVFIISDPHFADSDCKFMDPNWPEPEEQVKTINRYVSKNDTLVILGDIGDTGYVKKLRGYKVMVSGNHDSGVTKYTRKTWTKSCFENGADISDKLRSEPDFVTFSENEEGRIACFDNRLFDEVYDGPVFIAQKILLSHEPVHGLRYCLNIHGHVHNGEDEWMDSDGGLHINVASDVAGYKPVSLGKLIEGGKLSTIDDIHRRMIDRASGKAVKNAVVMKRPVNEELWQFYFSRESDDPNRKTYSELVADTGRFENDVFAVRQYDIEKDCYADDVFENPCFIHKPSGFMMNWYKYPLRSPESNFTVSSEEFRNILIDCINSLYGPGGTFCENIIYECEKWWENKKEQ